MKITDLKIAVARKKLLHVPEVTAVKARQRKMGIIIDTSGKESIKDFLKLQEDLHLKTEDFKVVMCGKKEGINDTFEYPLVSLQDLKWNGKISDETLAFLETEYDVLISFTATENKMANFLVRVCRAEIKVGRERSVKNDIFDLTISAGLLEPEIFTTELKKYLKVLNTAIA